MMSVKMISLTNFMCRSRLKVRMEDGGDTTSAVSFVVDIKQKVDDAAIIITGWMNT